MSDHRVAIISLQYLKFTLVYIVACQHSWTHIVVHICADVMKNKILNWQQGKFELIKFCSDSVESRQCQRDGKKRYFKLLIAVWRSDMVICDVTGKSMSGTNWYRRILCFHYRLRSDSFPPTSNHKRVRGSESEESRIS